MKQRIRSTTVLCVRRDNKVVMAGDGQVTLGHEVLKSSAKKLRRIYNDKILTGFAGSTADRSEEHTSELQSLRHLVCRLLLEKKTKSQTSHSWTQHNASSCSSGSRPVGR